MTSQKRTLDAFFTPLPKKAKQNESPHEDFSTHKHYPHPIPYLPRFISQELSSLPARPGKEIKDQPDLDLLHFQPYIPAYLAKDLFQFLRAELPFYRVEYAINRGGVQTQVRTPRFTTVFGLDETSKFEEEDGSIIDAKSGFRVQDKRYDKCPPRPIPRCLDDLRRCTESATACRFNFCLVNYYASGSDSIAFHSDDERFLGAEPAIASFSLGATRDFVMKHKPGKPNDESKLPAAIGQPIKFALGSGDMILMRGTTQSHWLHSIPKRSGKNQDGGGRINITFRRAMVKDGTENYYRYNVGTSPVYRWDHVSKEMRVSNGEKKPPCNPSW